MPGLVISPYARQGYIDHQTLSFDAYLKFIEDDFLGGQRLDPRTDGRPDPRPDVRESQADPRRPAPGLRLHPAAAQARPPQPGPARQRTRAVRRPRRPLMPARMLVRVMLAGAVVLASSANVTQASAATVAFNGNCQISGPISPHPPITIFPVPGSGFSYHGSGTCGGHINAASVASAPATITFTNVSTLFDTCELGPDFNLHGLLKIAAGGGTDRFPIVINLARLALVGPFLLTTPGGGLAAGIAQFTPAHTATAIQECAGSGIAKASLSASFNTLSALVGVSRP